MHILFAAITGLLVAFLFHVNIMISFGFLFIAIYFLLPLNIKVYILITSVVIPFALPFLNLRLTEFLSPLVLVVILFDTYKYAVQFRRNVFSGLPFIFKFAIAIIITWSLVNYYRKPVGGYFLLAASFREGGMRAYYQIFVGIFLFFCAFLYFKHYQFDQERLFKCFIVLALTVGLLRLLGFYYSFILPFVSGVFRFAEDSGSTYTRIGGLNEMTLLGIASVLAVSFKKKITLWIQAVLLLFSFLLIPAGGRTYFFAIVGSLVLYFTIFEPRRILNYTPYFVLIIATIVVMSFTPKFSSQIERLFGIGGGFAAQDSFRSVTYDYYVNSFLINPLFGKGIGYAPEIIVGSARESDFVYQQLMQGGHGAYLSMLGLWGIGGLIFLLSMLAGGIYYSIFLIKMKQYEQTGIFCFFYLVVLSIDFISGGNGYSSMEMWLLCGLVAALISRSNGINVDN